MKMLATAALLIGASILLPTKAHADMTQCGDVVTSTLLHVIPPWCPIGDEYDAGDVYITRTCRDPNNLSLQCTTKWIESYMHRVGADCGDGGFVEQLNAIYENNCP
jgi:hypothetical protein